MNLIRINIKNMLLTVMAPSQYELIINQSFKSYINGDDVYSFIDNMIEESKYCSEVMKKNILTKICDD